MHNFFNNKNILIFGASGYIGSNLTNKLKYYKCNIVRITSKLSKLSKLSNSTANIIDIEINFKDKYFLGLIKNSHIVYYLSAQTSTYEAEKDILKDYNDNAKPIVILLNKIKKYNNKPIVIFSSAVTICGLNNSILVDEKAQENPITIYDIHKLAIEKYIKFFISKNYIKGCILRLSNVYGPGIESSSLNRGILNLMIKKAINKEDITVYGDGNFIRDYIFIDDVVEAFLQSSINIENTNNKHYIIGSGRGTRIKNAFNLIKKTVYKLLKINVNVNEIDMPFNISMIEYRNFTANNASFKNDTNWNAITNLEHGIEKTMVFFININNKAKNINSIRSYRK